MPRHRYNLPVRGVGQSPIRQPLAKTQLNKAKESKKTFLYLGIVLGIVLVGFLIYFFIIRDSGPDKLMDLTIKQIDDEVESGGDLHYEIEALNLGKEDTYDIILKHDVYNTDGGYFPALGKQETVALQDKSIFPNTLTVTLAPGTYRLRITAIYEGERAIASKTFEVIEQGETPTPEPESTPTPEPEPTPPPTPTPSPTPSPTPTPEPEPEPDRDFTRVSGLSDSELEAQALDKASTNVQKAVDLCLSISSEYNQDFCLGQAAKKSEKDYFCKMIAAQNRRDGCYMDLALKGDDSDLCEKIVDGYNRNTCLALT